MRFTQRGAIVIGVALAGLAPAATTMAATPVAAAGRGTAPPAQRCVHVTATISVGRIPQEVAVNPATNTVYVAYRGG